MSRPKGGRQSLGFGGDNLWNLLGMFGQNIVPNPDCLTVEDYRSLSREVAIKAAIKYTALTVMANFGPYENPNARAKKMVDELFDRCETSLADWGYEAISCSKWAGYSATEEVYYYDAGKIWVKELPVIDPAFRFIIEQDITSPNYGKVSGLIQDAVGLINPDRKISIDRLLLHTNNPAFGNPYGESDIKAIYPQTIAKRAMFLQWGRTLEKYGTPPVIGATENLNGEEDSWLTPGTTTTRGDNVMDMLERLGEDALAVLPEDVRIQLLELKAAVGEDFERHQNFCTKEQLRAFLIPALLFEPTDIGSFALGEKHFEIFLASSIDDTERLQRSLMRGLIAPILRWNLGPNVPLGGFAKPQLTKEMLQALSAIFFSLTNAGYMDPGARDDSDFVRSFLRMKPFNDEQLAKSGERHHAKKAGAGENLPAGQAPDGNRGTDPGQPSATPQAPGTPQGRSGRNA